MLELSFELGIPEEELAARLTNRSFRRYQHHAAKWMLPGLRLQLQLAQVAFWVAKAGGAANIELADFLFTAAAPDEDDDDNGEPVDDLQAAIEFFQFAPMKKPAALEDGAWQTH